LQRARGCRRAGRTSSSLQHSPCFDRGVRIGRRVNGRPRASKNFAPAASASGSARRNRTRRRVDGGVEKRTRPRARPRPVLWKDRHGAALACPLDRPRTRASACGASPGARVSAPRCSRERARAVALESRPSPAGLERIGAAHLVVTHRARGRVTPAEALTASRCRRPRASRTPSTPMRRIDARARSP
jgi:hypothetical protein